jgi:hypothetical protein
MIVPGKNRNTRRKLAERHFVHLKSHMDWPGIEAGHPLYMTFGDWLITLTLQIMVFGDGKLMHHWSPKTWMEESTTEN